jgi:hypothetical protein
VNGKTLPSAPYSHFYLDDIGGTVAASPLVKSPKIDITRFIDYRSYRTTVAISYKKSIKKDIIKKEYVFHIMAPDGQRLMTRSHTYLSSIKDEYRTCFLCKVRKSMVCVKCGSCLLCHPFAERIESSEPVFYTGIAMLFDIESPALSEIKR